MPGIIPSSIPRGMNSTTITVLLPLVVLIMRFLVSRDKLCLMSRVVSSTVASLFLSLVAGIVAHVMATMIPLCLARTMLSFAARAASYTIAKMTLIRVFLQM